MTNREVQSGPIDTFGLEAKKALIKTALTLPAIAGIAYTMGIAYTESLYQNFKIRSTTILGFSVEDIVLRTYWATAQIVEETPWFIVGPALAVLLAMSRRERLYPWFAIAVLAFFFFGPRDDLEWVVVRLASVPLAYHSISQHGGSQSSHIESLRSNVASIAARLASFLTTGSRQKARTKPGGSRKSPDPDEEVASTERTSSLVGLGAALLLVWWAAVGGAQVAGAAVACNAHRLHSESPSVRISLGENRIPPSGAISVDGELVAGRHIVSRMRMFAVTPGGAVLFPDSSSPLEGVTLLPLVEGDTITFLGGPTVVKDVSPGCQDLID